MEFSDAELVELRSRCLMASQRGYAIARADVYMEALGGDAGEGMPTAAQLYEAVKIAIEERATGVKKSKKKADKPKAPEKPKAEAKKPEPPKPEPAKEEPPVVEVKDEAPKDAKPEEVPPYEEWTYDELYAEAQARDIPGRSALKNKEALALALYEHDEAEAKKAQ